MDLLDKAWWSGLLVGGVFLVLLMSGYANNVSVNFIISIWVLYLCFHSRDTKRTAIAVLLGLLGWMIGGWALGLLLLVLSLVLFYRAWL